MPAAAKVNPPAKRKKSRRVRWALYIMLLPALALVAVYSYGPLMGLVIAFQKFEFSKGLFGSQWVGFENFRYIFGLQAFTRALSNTLFISAFKIVLGLIFPIIVAILLNEVRLLWYKRTVQTFIYLPFFISWVIIAGLFKDILSPNTGALNAFLALIGLKPVYFMGNANIFPFTVIFTDLWKGFGYASILYLAAILGIDPSLYEAARVDGANRFRRMLNITVPGIVPIIVLNATLKLGTVLDGGFDQVQNMISPVVYKFGDIIDTLVYRVGIQASRDSMPRYDVAAAIGLFKSVVSFFLVSIAYYLAHRFADYRIF
ncbi:MAG: ABC transporter permease subunit [Firmicutes bacterium]|nr:ABC transporter permease subunit [Bacillota bacterium]